MKKLLTLCLVCKPGKILLGLKKRGFGQGRWNGFGGKVNEGESIDQAASRELQEESGLLAHSLKKMGVLDFQWQHKPSEVLEVHVYHVADFSGVISESEEMKPEWFDVEKVPFESMWSDDKYWFPLFLQDKKFKGSFTFDSNDAILKHELHEY